MEQSKKSIRPSKNIVRDITESLGKLPPQALDMEETVLGALMLEKKAMNSVAHFLKPDHFYSDAHKTIYEVIFDLFKSSEPIDMRTVVAKLRKVGKLELVGGAYSISELTSKVSSAANIEYHARVILEHAIKRNLIELGSDIHQKAYDDTEDCFNLLDYIQGRFDTLSDGSLKGDFVNIRKLYDEGVKRIIARRKMEGVTGIPCGLDDVDELTAGFQKTNLIIIAARPGMGKLQPLTEPILTPNGWVLMGDIKKGSEVICPVTGTKANVIGIFPQDDLKIYKILFNDGTWTECCNEHLWKIQTQTDVKNNKWRIVDVDWMIKNGVLDNRNKSKFRIQLTNPVEFNDQEIKLDPYLLGLFIGNGCISSKYTVTITNHSDVSNEIFKRIKNSIPEDVSIRLDKEYGKSKCKRITFTSEIRKYFDELLDKKSREKFIPKNYLYNSVSVRMELLKGLMDSDGSCAVFSNKKKASYSTMSRQLKDDVIELVRSLGGKASASSETRKKYKNNGRCWNVRIRVPFNPFHISYKKDRFDSFPYKETFTKTIRSIKYLRNDQGQCIKVDSKDNLYITRGYTVTHNTATVVCMLRNIAIMLDKPVAFFSLEMSGEELIDRMISSECEIDLKRIRNGNLTDEEEVKIKNDTQLLANAPLFIDDSPSLTILELRARARRLKATENIELIVVDYLQLMSADSERGKFSNNREQEIAAISRGLKKIAKELDIPVIALSQLSRGVESRGGSKRPMLSDLRESGAIEQDADIVLFLYRPEYYKIMQYDDNSSTIGVMEVIAAKNRNGNLDAAKVNFIGRYTKVKNFVNSPSSRTPKDFTQSQKPDDDELPF